MTAGLAGAAGEAIESGLWLAGEDAEARTVVVVSADAGLRQRLVKSLEGLRWRIREAAGGAQAMLCLEERGCEAMLVDWWLPDLEANEFVAQVRLLYPAMEVWRLDGGLASTADWLDEDGRARSPRRNELLHAIREARAGDAARG